MQRFWWLCLGRLPRPLSPAQLQEEAGFVLDHRMGTAATISRFRPVWRASAATTGSRSALGLERILPACASPVRGARFGVGFTNPHCWHRLLGTSSPHE
jgi:hypothetical protein